MSKNLFKIILGLGILAAGVSVLAYLTLNHSLAPAWSPGGLWSGTAEADHIDGREYQIKDVDQVVLSKTSRTVTVGDELITADGNRYQVKKITGFNAQAEFMGLDRELLSYKDLFEELTWPVLSSMPNDDDWSQKPLAIYHTHSAESYVPSDGQDSKPYEGGILDVGDSLAAALEKKGVKVLHDKTPHEPRDKNAYYRSRRTAGELMRKNPVALIDVHRDGIPDPGYYEKQVNGEDVTQIRLVVGRQNPKMQSNMEFAKRIMAYSNKVHPGLVKEIFVAQGNYNQDLMSTAVLLEMGTHTNDKAAAQRGAALFADVLPGLLGIGGNAAAPDGSGSTSSSPGAWKTLAWILGITILGGGAFLLLSTGNLTDAKKRLSNLMGEEFAGLTQPFRKKEQSSNADQHTDPADNHQQKSDDNARQ